MVVNPFIWSRLATQGPQVPYMFEEYLPRGHQATMTSAGVTNKIASVSSRDIMSSLLQILQTVLGYPVSLSPSLLHGSNIKVIQNLCCKEGHTCDLYILYVCYNHVAQVRSKDPLMQAGIDSLAALEMRNNIQASFAIEAPATIIYDYPSVQALASYIEDRMSISQPNTSYNGLLEPTTEHVRITCEQSIHMKLSSHFDIPYFLIFEHAIDEHPGLQRRERGLSDVKRKLQEIANVILGMEVSPQQPLIDAGLDSLAATEMRNAISTSFREDELPATFVFDYPTIDAMVQYFVTEHEVANTIVVPIAAERVPKDGSYSSEIIGMSHRYPNNGHGTVNSLKWPHIDISSSGEMLPQDFVTYGIQHRVSNMQCVPHYRHSSVIPSRVALSSFNLLKLICSRLVIGACRRGQP